MVEGGNTATLFPYSPTYYLHIERRDNMDKANQKRINRNNRKRGGSFEKKVADYLGFDVVPYSGSNARYGFGDVRNDDWLIECKNITPTDGKITIKQLWIEKNRKRADDVGKRSCIAWMPAGKADKFILMEYEDYAPFGVSPDYSHTIVAKVHNTKNLIFNMSEDYIKDIRHGLVVEFVFEGISYFMMSLEHYKEMISSE